MSSRKSSTTADILNFISDGKIHTLQEIADEVEISYSTAKRHIQSLSYRYPIETFCGGINRGGVRLDSKKIYQGKILSNDELQLIYNGLKLLQKLDPNDNNEKISKLLKNFTPTEVKGVS